MTVGTRRTPAAKDKDSPAPKGSKARGLPLHLQKQLLQDIEEAGGCKAFKFLHLCDRKPDFYGAPGSERRRQIQNKYYKWSNYTSSKYVKLLKTFELLPKVPFEEVPFEERLEEVATPAPTRKRQEKLPPISPLPPLSPPQPRVTPRMPTSSSVNSSFTGGGVSGSLNASFGGVDLDYGELTPLQS